MSNNIRPQTVFVSYATADDHHHGGRQTYKLISSLICRLKDVLEGSGIDFYWDREDTSKDAPACPEILGAARSADHMIIVLSDNWLKSSHCINELQTRLLHSSLPLEQRYQVSTIWIEDFSDRRRDLPTPLGSIHGYRFFINDGEMTRVAKEKGEGSNESAEIQWEDEFMRLVTGIKKRSLTIASLREGKPSKWVFLADGSDEVQETRRQLAAILTDKGSLVWPPFQFRYLQDEGLFNAVWNAQLPDGTVYVKILPPSASNLPIVNPIEKDETQKAIEKGYDVWMWADPEQTTNAQPAVAGQSRREAMPDLVDSLVARATPLAKNSRPSGTSLCAGNSKQIWILAFDVQDRALPANPTMTLTDELTGKLESKGIPYTTKLVMDGDRFDVMPPRSIGQIASFVLLYGTRNCDDQTRDTHRRRVRQIAEELGIAHQDYRIQAALVRLPPPDDLPSPGFNYPGVVPQFACDTELEQLIQHLNARPY